MRTAAAKIGAELLRAIDAADDPPDLDRADAETASAWLKEAMIDGMQPLAAPIHVDVEVTVRKNWAGD